MQSLICWTVHPEAESRILQPPPRHQGNRGGTVGKRLIQIKQNSVDGAFSSTEGPLIHAAGSGAAAAPAHSRGMIVCSFRRRPRRRSTSAMSASSRSPDILRRRVKTSTWPGIQNEICTICTYIRKWHKRSCCSTIILCKAAIVGDWALYSIRSPGDPLGGKFECPR